jgi:DNA-binding NtrC family response regulator
MSKVFKPPRAEKYLYPKKRNEYMTSAALRPIAVTPQFEPANFLNLLIVDDERSIREACREVAQSLGFSAQIADSAEQAYRALESQSYDAVLLDLRLPGAGGLDALRRIKDRRPEAVVIVVTGYGTVQSAVQAMKNGAYDYVTKPFSVDELKLLLERVASHLKLKSENRLLREKVKSKQGFGGIVGRAPEMEKLYRIIAKAANSVHPVLILGESGTGKELVARSIHYSGPFRDKPFIPVDCGSLVPTLIESELFGYVKGAFTGANQTKDGLLSMAEGGTVFLDEVGELPVDLQAKMLRAIQEKEIRPVGGTRRIPINVRILAATNRDLEQAVMQGEFRRDLYFRLNVLSLRIPALRERRQDIPLLIGHFLERMTRAAGQEKIISDEALKAMLSYDWPGNVRELENCLERSYAFTTGPLIHSTDLPREVATLPVPESANGNSNGNGHGKIIPIAELEKQTILRTITELNGDKLQAARLLGIGKTTLYRKLKDYAAQEA